MDLIEYDDEETSETEDAPAEELNDFFYEQNETIHSSSFRPYVYKQNNTSKRRNKANILRERSGLLPNGRVGTIMDSFHKFFDDEMIETIMHYSNLKAASKNTEMFSKEELLAYIGLSIIMGIHNDTKRSIPELWSDEGSYHYPGTMSKHRFKDIASLITFDDKSTREEKKKIDKFAPMREIYEKLNEKLPKMFKPGANLCVDEMLSLFRGRCAFKVYQPDKPGKYGFLIRMVADCDTNYILKMDFYSGKSSTMNNSASEVVKRLISPWILSGRNITMDRYYTSVDLAESLYQHQLTVVGTLNANRKHIPDELKIASGRDKNTSIFCFTNPDDPFPPVTLQSFIPRKGKVLFFLSTQHDQEEYIDDEKQMSVINKFYNKTKGTVDNCDQMVRQYSVKRQTRRWTMSIFATFVDIMLLNGYALFIMNFPEWNENRIDRRKLFLRELAMGLIKPLVEKRAENLNGFRMKTLSAMEKILGRDLKSKEDQITAPKQGTSQRCYKCLNEAEINHTIRKMSKCSIICDNCQKTICGKHTKKVCFCSPGCENNH